MRVFEYLNIIVLLLQNWILYFAFEIKDFWTGLFISVSTVLYGAACVVIILWRQRHVKKN